MGPGGRIKQIWGSFCALHPHHPARGAAAHRLQCQVQGRHHTDQKGSVWSSSMGIKLLFLLGRDQIVVQVWERVCNRSSCLCQPPSQSGRRSRRERCLCCLHEDLFSQVCPQLSLLYCSSHFPLYSFCFWCVRMKVPT